MLKNAGAKKKAYRLKADTEQEANDWYNTLIGSADALVPKHLEPEESVCSFERQSVCAHA